MTDAALAPGSNSTAALDVERIREDFPILKQQVYGKPLVYLDNGASSQQPRPSIWSPPHLARLSWSLATK